jgi:hypothetical protein
MTYKFNCPDHENVTAEQQLELMRGGKMKSLQNDARQRWNKLVEHAQSGNCTCHIGQIGEVNILSACVTGRNLKEEYENSYKLLQEYKK